MSILLEGDPQGEFRAAEFCEEGIAMKISGGGEGPKGVTGDRIQGTIAIESLSNDGCRCLGEKEEIPGSGTTAHNIA